MAVLPIRLFGDPVLTTPAEPVTTFDAELRRLVRNLDQTLYDQLNKLVTDLNAVLADVRRDPTRYTKGMVNFRIF